MFKLIHQSRSDNKIGMSSNHAPGIPRAVPGSEGKGKGAIGGFLSMRPCNGGRNRFHFPVHRNTYSGPNTCASTMKSQLGTDTLGLII